MPVGDILLSYCSSCKGVTKHKVVCLHHKHYTAEDSPQCSIDFASADFSTLECLGCETVHFEALWNTSEDDPEEQQKPTRYPEDSKDRLVPKQFENTPRRLKVIYGEVLKCYNDGSYILAAAGIRALMEAVCVEKGIADGPVEQVGKGGATKIVRRNDLRGKIEGMREAEVISATDAKAFHACRFLGNDAVHELLRPTSAELKLAIEIVEHTLDSVFEVPKKTEEVQEIKRSRKSHKR
jgi:hypothetical protein